MANCVLCGAAILPDEPVESIRGGLACELCIDALALWQQLANPLKGTINGYVPVQPGEKIPESIFGVYSDVRDVTCSPANEDPKVGQTWKAKDGKVLTIKEERNDLHAIVGAYFVYLDIDGNTFYSRKNRFHDDFSERLA